MEADVHCIGYTNFTTYQKPIVRRVYRIGIFDPNYQAKGLGTETTRLLLAYGFEIIQWYRIELRVLKYNHRAIRCMKSADLFGGESCGKMR